MSKLEEKADPNYVLDNGDTLLIAAIKSGNFEAAKTLIDLGADVNKPGINDMSPVQHAAAAIIKDGTLSKNNGKIDKSIEFFEHILDKGADVFHKNYKGMSLNDSINTLKTIHKKEPERHSEAAEKKLIASFSKKGPSRWKTLTNFLFKPKKRIGTVAKKPTAEKLVGNSKAVAALERIKSYKLKYVVDAAKVTPVKTPQKSQLSQEQQKVIKAKAAQKASGMSH